MNFMQRFPSLKYQDRRDKKFASKRDDPIMKSYPKTTWTLHRRRCQGGQRDLKEKKLKDGADQVIYFDLSFVCRVTKYKQKEK